MDYIECEKDKNDQITIDDYLDEIKFKICSRVQCKYKGEEQPIENFIYFSNGNVKRIAQQCSNCRKHNKNRNRRRSDDPFSRGQGKLSESQKLLELEILDWESEKYVKNLECEQIQIYVQNTWNAYL